MRLDLAQLLWSDQTQSRQAVGSSAPAHLLETRKFIRVSRYDYFSADVVGDAMLAAELDHGRCSGDAQPRLQRAWFVIDAGVNYSAVASALVTGNAVFFLDQQ